MNSIKIEILGKNYPIKVEEGQEQVMRKIAGFVDKRFRQFKDELKNQPDTTVMTLASLSIAEELFEEQRRNETPNEDDIEKKVYKTVNNSLTELLQSVQ